MTRPITVEEKVGQWFAAYSAISETITAPKMRESLAVMSEVEGIAQLEAYMSLARNVMANDRAAATVAAMLVATGIKPAPIDYEDVGEVE